MFADITLYYNSQIADNLSSQKIDNTQVRYQLYPMFDLSDPTQITKKGKCNYFITRQKFTSGIEEFNQVCNNLSITLDAENKINLIANYVEPFSLSPTNQNLFNIFEVNSSTGIFKGVKKVKIEYDNVTGFRTIYLYK